MTARDRLGWSAFFEDQLGEASPAPQVSRVVEEQRGAYRVAGDFDGCVEVSGKFRHDARSTADFPAVGDWVCVSASGTERGLIVGRLERRSKISRKAAGRVVEEQVVAANVDTIFLVTALTEDLNPRRIERYLTVVQEAGAVPVVVLNKTDLSADAEVAANAVRARLPFVDVVGVSAKHAHGLESLNAYLTPARTVALIGSSGVGKSTLVNRLLGHDLLKTAATRAEDGKGRHTTTSRHLVELPGGALLIDTPGMRELQPWVEEAAVAETFDDITGLAQGCRFSNCEHRTEPGCSVLAAVAEGALAAERLDHYRDLGREIAFEERKRDKAAAADQKRRWKKIHQAQKALYRDRDR
ncbi:MAG TPA: ribosome small subunit-dependent GTPase A [Vicinamibacterales bacterium]|nr:ribosome small subunit-dependent GTPase A [Vicinamibacterales bacterium]